jgi:catechol 2,3-dioxygenase-like lactoylglutathione lyase family enzyme
MRVDRVQHSALDVDDLAAAIAFYVDQMGFSVAPRPESLGENGVWLDVPGGAQVHLVESPTFAPPATGQHIAFEVSDVDACIDDLRAGGVKVSDAFDIGAGRQAFLSDPAGNLLELNQPT